MIKPSATFFIIPGFRQKATDKSFSWLVKYLKKRNFKVILVPIVWNYRVMSDYLGDFKDFYNKNKSSKNYVLGFSYGAIIAFVSANDLKPTKIYLCSLSPEFKEDIPPMRPWIKKLVGKRRLADSSTRSARKIARELKIPSVVFYGEKEGKQYPELKLRCEETNKLAKFSNLVVVSKSTHKIDHPNYISAIKSHLAPCDTPEYI